MERKAKLGGLALQLLKATPGIGRVLKEQEAQLLREVTKREDKLRQELAHDLQTLTGAPVPLREILAGEDGQALERSGMVRGTMLGGRTIQGVREAQQDQRFLARWSVHSWTKAATNKIAKACHRADTFVRPVKGVKDPNPEHKKALRNLILHPNPRQSLPALIYVTAIRIKVTGESHWEIVYDDSNTAQQLYFLEGDIYPQADEHGTLKDPAYIQKVLGGRSNVEFSADEVIEFLNPNPYGGMHGSADMEALEIAIPTDLYMARWERDFFRNSTKPDGLWILKGQQDSSMAVRNKEEIRAAANATNKGHASPTVLEGDVEYHDMSTAAKDSDYNKGRQNNREEVSAVIGTPGSKMGMTEKVNRATMSEQNRNFQEDEVDFILSIMDSRINAAVADYWGIDDYEVHFSSGTHLTPTESSILIRSGKGYQTINEVRTRILKLPPIKGGDIILVQTAEGMKPLSEVVSSDAVETEEFSDTEAPPELATEELDLEELKAMDPIDFLISADPDGPEVEQLAKGDSIPGAHLPGNWIGNKRRILDWLIGLVPKETRRAADAFSGSSSVAYRLKQEGMEVLANDRLHYCYHIARAVVQNQHETLEEDMVLKLCGYKGGKGFIADKFRGTFFGKDAFDFIENVRLAIDHYGLSGYRRSIALFALGYACTRGKKGFKIFTVTSATGGDQAASAQKLKAIFQTAVKKINACVFDNGKRNIASRQDVKDFLSRCSADFVYFDPPYTTEFSKTAYGTTYHFLEGLMIRWKGIEIDESKKAKTPKNAEPALTKKTAPDFFEGFLKAANGIRNWMISYRDKAYPTKPEIFGMIKSFGRDTKAHSTGIVYSTATRDEKRSDASHAKEYIFVCKKKGAGNELHHDHGCEHDTREELGPLTFPNELMRPAESLAKNWQASLQRGFEKMRDRFLTKLRKAYAAKQDYRPLADSLNPLAFTKVNIEFMKQAFVKGQEQVAFKGPEDPTAEKGLVDPADLDKLEKLAKEKPLFTIDWETVPKREWEILRTESSKLSDETVRRLVEGDKTGRAHLKQILEDGWKQGLRLEELEENVRSLFRDFSTWQSRRIVRSETNPIYNMGRIIASQKAGYKYGRVSTGPRACQQCLDKANETMQEPAPLSELYVWIRNTHPNESCVIIAVPVGMKETRRVTPGVS